MKTLRRAEQEKEHRLELRTPIQNCEWHGKARPERSTFVNSVIKWRRSRERCGCVPAPRVPDVLVRSLSLTHSHSLTAVPRNAFSRLGTGIKARLTAPRDAATAAWRRLSWQEEEGKKGRRRRWWRWQWRRWESAGGELLWGFPYRGQSSPPRAQPSDYSKNYKGNENNSILSATLPFFSLPPKYLLLFYRDSNNTQF